MNNCTNPLKLTYSPQLFVGYKVNKPNIGNCELVDKDIADQLFNALTKVVESNKKFGEDSSNRKICRIEQRDWNEIENALKKEVS